MANSILVISDALVEPPTEMLAFRSLTMIVHDNLMMDILLHTTQEMKDFYYHWMKPRGMLDYVCYILNELEWEEGVRIDSLKCYPNTIITRAILFENHLNLLGQVKSLAGR